MKNTLTLETPLKVNNKTYKELDFDISEISAQMFAEADANKMRASGSKSGNLSGAAELDYSLHLYLGFAAIIAVNPEIDMTDLERIKGFDTVKIMRIGRDFISGKSGAPSGPSSSGEPSETTPEPSTPPSDTSESDG